MTQGAWHISRIYAATGAAWIILSSVVVWNGAVPSTTEIYWETGKGLLFIAVTTALLHLLVRRWERELLAKQSALETANRSLAEANNRLSGILSGSHDLIAAWDRQKRLVALNPRYREVVRDFFGVAASAGTSFDEMFGSHPKDQAEFAACWDRALAGERFVRVQHLTRNGQEAWFETSYGALTGADGEIIGGFHIVRDVSERMLMERERQAHERDLSQAVESLTEINSELERFTYVASHDLQEPLRTITAFTQLLERRSGDKLDAESREILDFIVQGAKRMHDLIRDLLAFARVTKSELRHELVSTQDACAIALENLREAISASGADLIVSALPAVHGDRLQIMQVFQNLIGNAVKFRRPGIQPRIEISAALAGDEWLFSIKDNGIGFNAAHQDIFELFRRHHTAAEYPGTGVGLSICKSIIQRHGGRIYAEATPGKGSTFFFTLPMLQTAQDGKR